MFGPTAHDEAAPEALAQIVARPERLLGGAGRLGPLRLNGP